MATGLDQFDSIDLNTGVFTQLGNMGQLLSGLGVAGGNLYGGVCSSACSGTAGGVNVGNILYQVNPATGALTPVGTGSIAYGDTGSTTTGLYAVGTNADLYSIDPTTGVATLIGPTGLAFANTVGLSTGATTLYYTQDRNLYSLNTTTGSATLIGSTGLRFGAMVFENGTLYGGSTSNDRVYALNTSTGAATFVSNTGGISGTFWGLAPYPLTAATPEPSSLLLLGTALLGLTVLVRRNL